MINDRLEEMLFRKPDEPDQVYFRRCLDETIELFVKDSITRHSNIFSYQQQEFHYTGFDVKEVFLKKASELYLSYLQANPDKIKKIADRNIELLFLQQIKFAQPIDEKHYADSYFPQELFAKMIEPEKTKLERGGMIEVQAKQLVLLNQILDSAKIPEKTIGSILASAPKLSRIEVESLVRFKLFELILFVNQNFQFLPTSFLIDKYTTKHPSSTAILSSFYNLEEGFDSLDFCMLMNLVSAEEGEVDKTAIIKVHIPTIYGNKQSVQCTIVPFSLV